MLTFFTDFAYRKLKTSLYFSPILILKTNFMNLTCNKRSQLINLIMCTFLIALLGCEQNEMSLTEHKPNITSQYFSLD
ncbi:hypothetical protein SAMN05444278_103217 [Psychroflexus salarius]|uniref:Uncharacterized protein n=1 Tax=Psychroflexus salarius TaxID=1155689 RepID=A0A1M4V2X5_9FLAO|nr:hypothetical protein SAMN05444278_103217 [Psychroflexus salarius]